jgi:hypothetical protein
LSGGEKNNEEIFIRFNGSNNGFFGRTQWGTQWGRFLLRQIIFSFLNYIVNSNKRSQNKIDNK